VVEGIPGISMNGCWKCESIDGSLDEGNIYDILSGMDYVSCAEHNRTGKVLFDGSTLGGHLLREEKCIHRFKKCALGFLSTSYIWKGVSQ